MPNTGQKHRILFAFAIVSVALAGQDTTVCSATVIHAGDSFSISGLPSDHDGWVFGIRKGGTLFLISYSNEFAYQFKAKLPPMLDAREFSKMSELKVDTKSAKGVPLDMQGNRAEGPARKIFTKSGKYHVYLTPSLSAEGATVMGCTVRYEVASGH